MKSTLLRRTALAASLLQGLLALPASAQTSSVRDDPIGGRRLHLEIPGKVNDLTVISNGWVFYCTEEREVGFFRPNGAKTKLADAGSGGFPFPLRGVVVTPAGDVCVVDTVGDIWRLPNGLPPAVQLYDDFFMIEDPTDLVVVDNGVFLIVSSTPSNGLRCINWISSDGFRWAYFLVRHNPVALAPDPLTGGLLLADKDAGGSLRRLDTSKVWRPSYPVDTSTPFGFQNTSNNGDMAVLKNGDVLAVGAGGKVYFHDRSEGATEIFASGFGLLRGIAVSGRSGKLPGRKTLSAYVAEGANPTKIWEIPEVGPADPPVANFVGGVPGRGQQRLFFTGLKAYDLNVDMNGDLLVGGDLFGSNPSVRRIDVPSMNVSVIADAADGISGRVEGVVQDYATGDIYCVTFPGVIHKITENPTVVTTVYSDAMNKIIGAKDLALKEDGSFLVADREGFGPGKVVHVSGGVATTVLQASECRGLAPHPFTARFFVSQWNNSGFAGQVLSVDSTTFSWFQPTGPHAVNYSNDAAWSDGDVLACADGTFFTFSEDDWRLSRWHFDAEQGGWSVTGSGYINHPSGLAIAASTPGSGSTTGWSLYASEFDFLWEIPSVPAPARNDVACSAAATVGGLVAWFPRFYGKPRSLAPEPDAGRRRGESILVGTAGGWILRVDAATGAIAAVAGPNEGLRGAIVAIEPAPGGRWRVTSDEGRTLELLLGPRRPLAVRALGSRSPEDLAEGPGPFRSTDSTGRAYDLDAGAGMLRRRRAGAPEEAEATILGANYDAPSGLALGTRDGREVAYVLDSWSLYAVELDEPPVPVRVAPAVPSEVRPPR